MKDNRMPAEVMYSNASVAAKEGAGNYLKYFTYYTDEMDAKLKKRTGDSQRYAQSVGE